VKLITIRLCILAVFVSLTASITLSNDQAQKKIWFDKPVAYIVSGALAGQVFGVLIEFCITKTFNPKSPFPLATVTMGSIAGIICSGISASVLRKNKQSNYETAVFSAGIR
jgi:hypothetical protein